MRLHNGMSLMTLMALVAILAVIAALAIPALRSHRIMGRLDQARQAGDAAKQVVAEAVILRGGLAQLKPDDLSYNAQATANAYTARVEISQSGRIRIVTRDTGASPDHTFLLTPLEVSADKAGLPLAWSCDIIAGNAQWLPPSFTRPASPPATVAPAQAATR
jgi:type IV pilus assembly protein PilA